MMPRTYKLTPVGWEGRDGFEVSGPVGEAVFVRHPDPCSPEAQSAAACVGEATGRSVVLVDPSVELLRATEAPRAFEVGDRVRHRWDRYAPFEQRVLKVTFYEDGTVSIDTDYGLFSAEHLVHEDALCICHAIHRHDCPARDEGTA